MAQENVSGSGLDFDGAFEEAFGDRAEQVAPESAPPPQDLGGGIEAPRALDFDGAFEDMEADRRSADDNRLRTIFTIAQDGTADSQTRALEISRSMGVPVEMVEEHLQGWESAWRETQFDPQKLRETHPGHVDFLLRQPPKVAANVVRNEGWFMTLGRRLGAALDHLARSTVTPEPSVPGAADLLPSDFAAGRDSLLPTRDEREAALQQSGAETLETITGPRRTQTLEVDEGAAAGSTADRIGAAWGDARRQDEVSKLGFQLMTARSAGADTRDIENRIRRLQLTPTTRFYGQSLLEQPLIDATTLAASQFESLKAGGLGGLVGAGGGALVGTIARSPGAVRTLARIGWKTGGQAGTVGSSFMRESGGAYVEFAEAKTDEGETLTHEAAMGGAIVYGMVASALELDALSSFLGAFGPIGDAVRDGTGKVVVREMLAKNPAFRQLAADIFKRWGKGALGEAKEEGLQSIAQDVSEWLAKSAQAGNVQDFDIEETAAKAFDAGGTALTGMGAMGAVRAAPALMVAGHQSLTADPGGSPPGQALAETQRKVTEHRQSVAAGRQVDVLAQAAGERSDAIRAAPEAVAEYIGQETEASGEPVTHLYVDATAMARLYQSGTPGPDGITQEAAQAAEQLLGEGGAEKLREAVATGGRLEVPLADYLDRWGAVQVEAPTPTDTPVGEGASPTPGTGRRSIAEALARDTTTRPGLMLPSQVDPALLEQVERDAQKLAREFDADQRQADSVVESRFTDALTQQLVATRTFSRAEARQAANLARAFVRTQADRFNQPVEALFSDYSLLVERGRPGEWADTQFPFGSAAPVPLASSPAFTREGDIQALEAEDAKIRASIEAHASGVGDLHDSVVRMEELSAGWKSEEKKETLRQWIAYARGELDSEPENLRRDVVRQAIGEGVVPTAPDFRWEHWVADAADQNRGRRVARKPKGVSQYDMRDAEREGTTGRFTGRFAKRLSQSAVGEGLRTDAAPVLEDAYQRALEDGTAHVLYYRDPTTGLLGDRAMRDLPVDPERPNFAAITFAYKKPINDQKGLGHDALNEVYRALGRALHAHEPLAGKVGGDLWLPAVRDQAELDAILDRVREDARQHLPEELQDLPIIGAAAPRAEGEAWVETVHRVGDTLGATVDAARARSAAAKDRRKSPRGGRDRGGRRYPGREEVPERMPKAIPAVAPAEAAIPDAIRELWATLSPRQAATDIYIEADPDGSNGVLTKAGWDEVRTTRPRRFVVSADVRAVAAMDKTLGHLPTDELIARIRRAMARHGGHRFDAAHVSGDEFMFQADSREDFEAYAQALRDDLANAPLVVVDGAGSIFTQDGLHFAYGIAEGFDRAAELQADGVELPAVKKRDADAGRTKEHFAGRTQRIADVSDDVLRKVERQLEAAVRGLPGGPVYGPEAGAGGGSAAGQGGDRQAQGRGDLDGGDGGGGQRLGGLPGRAGTDGTRLEQSQAAEESLETILEEARSEGVKLDVYEQPSRIALPRIVVPEDLRGTGIGTRVMQRLIDYADRKGKPIALTPSTDFGASSRSRLVEFYRRLGFVQNKGRNRDFEISESMYRPPRLHQDETAAAGAAPRGSIDFLTNEAGQRLFRILLNPGSDRSTILHELGHGFLEMFGDLAERPDAPESVKQDWARTLEFLGVSDRNGIQVAEHEKWARGFEAYLFEGKAPSKALRGAFTRFKQWLRGVYRSIRSLNVTMNDEIRGVFDRLLATEEETARARAKSGLMPLFRSPDDAGLSPEAWQAYQRQVERSVSNAEFRAERVALDEQKRELEGWWREERRRHTERAEQAYQDVPGVRAWRYLRTGQAWWIPEGAEPDAPPRLDRATVERLAGAEAVRRLPGILEVGGVHPDDVAVVLGIPSGQQMIEAVLNRPERSQWVREEAERSMQEAHPDILRERERLEVAAQEALHAAPTSDWLLQEWAELRRRSGQQGAPPVESIRRAAQLLAERRTLREVTPGRILQQERAAAEKAALLTARGEFGQAYVAKQQQLLNHYLWRELTQAKRERESFEGLMDQAEGDAWRGRLGLADEGRVLRDFSDTILAWLGTRPRQDGERAPSVVELQQVLGELGLEAAFDTSVVEQLLQSPPLESVDSRVRLDSPAALALLEELYGADVARQARDPRTGGTSVTRVQKTIREHLPRGQGAQAIRDVRELLRQRGAVVDAPESVATWTSITVAEMRELNAALKQVSKAATDAQTALDEGRRVAIEELAGEILADSLALPRRPAPARSAGSEGMLIRLGQRWESIRSEMIDPEEMFRRLGPTAHRFFWDGYLKQRTLEQDMARDVMAVFDRIWEGLPEGMRARRHDLIDHPEITFDPGLAREGNLDREGLWMIALNMGNEGNMQRLLDGYGWERGQVMALLDRLMSREEWDFVQGVWDLMDHTLWPKMAEAYERQNGIRPPKVEAIPLVTAQGILRGGYFPAKYDPKESRRGSAQVQEGAANLFSDAATRASVSKGFTKARAERVKDVVDLQWGHVPSHVAKVIHFTAFGQWVLEASRVLLHPTMTRAADGALGQSYRKQLESWLKAVANPGALNSSEGTEAVAKALRDLRSHFVTATLGYSLTVAMGDLTNPLVAIASGDVGPRYVGGSFMSFTASPLQFLEQTLAESPELRHRSDNMANHMRREMGDVAGSHRRSPLGRIREHAFALFGVTDRITAAIVWEGARRDGLKQGKSHAAAVVHADGVIRSLFPAVVPGEQPSLLRNKTGVGALLAFYSYFSKIENRIRRDWHGPLSDLAMARTPGAKRDALLGLAGPAARTLAIFLVTGVLSELLSGRGAEDEEEWDEWLVRKTLAAPFALVPLAGFLGEHAVGRGTSFIWHGEARGRSLSARAAPVVSILERIGKATERAITSEEGDDRAWAAIEALLSLLGLPASQPLRTGRYLTDVVQGEAERDPVSGVLYGDRDRQPKGPVEALEDLVGR